MAIVGGGIAGAWLAYRLVQRGVPTVLVCADDYAPPLSRQWALGFIRQRVVDCGSVPVTELFAELFADGSSTQDPGYPAMMAEYFPREFDELTKLIEYKPLEEYVHPCLPEPGVRLGGGDIVVGTVLTQFEKLGGTTIPGRVTDLIVDGDRCRGVRYEHQRAYGEIRCADLVLASGGMCGLFADGVGDNTGYLLGTYARHGGLLSNLELFNRFALGDLDHGRPLYPFDFDGEPKLYRAGEPAVELARALDAYQGDSSELDVFTHYWTRNLGVPHSVELAAGEVRLGPVRGFAVGGIAPSWAGTTLRNVHATGECASGPSVDSISGKPFPSFMAMGGMLADRLARQSVNLEPDSDLDDDSGHDADPTGADEVLRQEVRRHLDSFQDNRFSVEPAESFARWCRQERTRRKTAGAFDNEDMDVLILAEAYTQSMMARTESRGFFFRGDLPATDSRLDNLITLARYDATNDQVHVTLVPKRNGAKV